MIRSTEYIKSFAPVAHLGETSVLCEVYFARDERPKSMILGRESGKAAWALPDRRVASMKNDPVNCKVKKVLRPWLSWVSRAFYAKCNFARGERPKSMILGWESGKAAWALPDRRVASMKNDPVN